MLNDTNLIVGMSAFCVVFGLMTCEIGSFLTGFFAGGAVVTAYLAYLDESER